MTDTLIRPAPSPPKRHLEWASLSLLVNTAVTGGLGIVFWIVAARLFPTDDVGAAVAASSLLIALSFAAQLNIATSLSRYLPASGTAQRSMVWFGYRAAVVAAVVVALGVMLVAALGVDVAGGGGVGLIVVMGLSIPVWVVFALQDSVLVAVRRSQWVPIENAVASVAKLVVLPLAVAFGSAGILVAWTAPALVLVLLVNGVLLRRFLTPGSSFTEQRGLIAYGLRDFPGAVMYLLSLRLVPLLVVHQHGAAEAAYIGVPWSIVTVAALVLPALSRSLLVELAHMDADPAAVLRRSFSLVLRFLLPCALVGFFASGPLLAMAGGAYEARGQQVLAWGLLGLVPAALIECQLAVLRFANRVIAATVVQVVRAVVLLGAVATLVVVDRSELIGVAFLVINAATALALVPVTRSSQPETTA